MASNVQEVEQQPDHIGEATELIERERRRKCVQADCLEGEEPKSCSMCLSYKTIRQLRRVQYETVRCPNCNGTGKAVQE